MKQVNFSWLLGTVLISLLSSIVTANAAVVTRGASLNNKSVSASFTLYGWNANYSEEGVLLAIDDDILGQGEKTRFLSSQLVNISAKFTPDRDDRGIASDIYIVVILNGSLFIKNQAGQWLPFTGNFFAADNRILGEEEKIDIVTGLSGLEADFDVLVGYSTASGDVVYSETPLHVEIKQVYDKVLTVGEHGDYQACDGLQMALNFVQDWNEIRIEQGNYTCTGLELSSGKEFDAGIKISGGWDSSFTIQSNDPVETVFDGGVKPLSELSDKESCEQAGKFWLGTKCFEEQPQSARILVVNDNLVELEKLTFQYAYADNYDYVGGAAIVGGENLLVNQCHFYNNIIDGGHGAAVFSAAEITNSIFRGNNGFDRSTVATSDGAAVFGISVISNSEFTENVSERDGGAARKVNTIINSIFNDNTARFGGAVYKVENVVSSSFNNNSAIGHSSNSGAGLGGAIYDVTLIKDSSFVGNKAYTGGAVNIVDDIQNSVFTENSARQSGGAVAAGFNSKISRSFFNKNMATGFGGAVAGAGFIDQSSFDENSAQGGGAVSMTSNAKLFISNSVFLSNNALQGGAILHTRDLGVKTLIINSLMANNNADQGGAVATEREAIIMNSTVVKNAATEQGGGIYSSGIIINSLLTNNTISAGISNDIHALDTMVIDYSLLGAISGTDIDIRSNASIGEAAYVDFANNDFHLQQSSSAINSGTVDFGQFDDIEDMLEDLIDGNETVDLGIDLEGNPRIQGTSIDLGAYEQS